MKKLICVVLLFSFVLSGCSKGNAIRLNAHDPVKLTLWNYYHGPQQNAFNDMIAEFNATKGLEQGIIVESYSYGGVNELAEAVMESATDRLGAKPMPDIFSLYSDTAYEIDKLGRLANIDDYLTEDERSEFIESYVQEGCFGTDNKMKIFPIAKASEVAMLNKTDFDIFLSESGSGISYQDLLTTQGIVKTAHAYYEWTDAKTPEPYDGKAFFGIDSLANLFLVCTEQMGNRMFVVNNGQVRINYTKESLKPLWDFYYTNMVTGRFTAKARYRSDDAKTGDLLYLLGSTSGAAYFPFQVTDPQGNTHPVEMATFATPVMDSGAKIAISQGAGMCVGKSEPTREYASVVFLKWFVEPERNIHFAIQSAGYMPVTKQAMDANRIQTAIQAEEDQENESSQRVIFENTSKTVQTFLDQYETYTLFAPTPYEKSNEVRKLIDELEKTTREAYEQAQSEIANGANYDEVIQTYCADEVYEAWFESFDRRVRALVAQNENK